MAGSREYSAEAVQSDQQVRVLVIVCVDTAFDIAGSCRMIDKGKTMADLPWASEESKNLVAASASRYASSAWPVAGEFRLSPALSPMLAFGRPLIATWTIWSAEMSYKQSGVMFSRRNKAREKCSAPADTSMSSSGTGFSCRPIVGIWQV